MSEDKREEIQEEALNRSLGYKRCSLVLSMRTGKTKIALDRIDIELKTNPHLKVLVVAPKLGIFDGWKKDAVKFGLTDLLSNIQFSTYLSLHKQALDYDLVILDEVHSLKESHLPWLEDFGGKILGLTGTPPKNISSPRGRLITKFCPIVYRYITNDAIEDNVLNDYRIIVHMLEISSKNTLPVKKKDGGIFYTSEEKTYNYWGSQIEQASTEFDRQRATIMRMKAMQGFLSKVNYTKELLKQIEDKVIIFANNKDQAQTLSKHSYVSGNKDSKTNLELFKLGEIDQLSCVDQLSEGVTIPDLKQGIIMHFYSGHSSKGYQRFGRLLGLNPEDDIAICHVLCYKGTVDEYWVSQALKALDMSKVKVIDTTNINKNESY